MKRTGLIERVEISSPGGCTVTVAVAIGKHSVRLETAKCFANDTLRLWPITQQSVRHDEVDGSTRKTSDIVSSLFEHARDNAGRRTANPTRLQH